MGACMTFYCRQCQAVVEETGASYDDVQVKHSVIEHDGDDVILVGTQWLQNEWDLLEKQFWDRWMGA
ncbi:hypothetical protein HVTV-2_gp171 [Haloarcula virus HVTV-2]|uniref:Uncharacterized protein n=1 Tax=Haloarcula vallismortis tailed virus 1 TaxID=1262528 RepID=L7TJH9_9CAUD|nr:hypothetical protein HVTV1_169 [Haloarcula vallismortis tailed virus 1]AGC34538.1 hypothetical protein HVTV1_169 [Haloarcula vallismortis tailed virus 1]UBF22978.1 hypothetical protein HVTV-2_gp171 [Haloarcula virus HVTV-2]